MKKADEVLERRASAIREEIPNAAGILAVIEKIE